MPILWTRCNHLRNKISSDCSINIVGNIICKYSSILWSICKIVIFNLHCSFLVNTLQICERLHTAQILTDRGRPAVKALDIEDENIMFQKIGETRYLRIIKITLIHEYSFTGDRGTDWHNWLLIYSSKTVQKWIEYLKKNGLLEQTILSVVRGLLWRAYRDILCSSPPSQLSNASWCFPHLVFSLSFSFHYHFLFTFIFFSLLFSSQF